MCLFVAHATPGRGEGIRGKDDGFSCCGFPRFLHRGLVARGARHAALRSGKNDAAMRSSGIGLLVFGASAGAVTVSAFLGEWR